MNRNTLKPEIYSRTSTDSSQTINKIKRKNVRNENNRIKFNFPILYAAYRRNGLKFIIIFDATTPYELRARVYDKQQQQQQQLTEKFE